MPERESLWQRSRSLSPFFSPSSFSPHLCFQFEDNQPTLDLLELKVTGIFSMIDEEISVPKGSDESLLSKIFQKHQSHRSLQRAKAKIHKNIQECFVVVHYAGEVAYNVTGFLEKNKDSLSPDLEELGRSSSLAFVSDFFMIRVCPFPLPPPPSLSQSSCSSPLSDSLHSSRSALRRSRTQSVIPDLSQST
jgi:myosin heavy subunit